MNLKKHLHAFACSIIAAGAASATTSSEAGENAQKSWFRVLDRDANGSVSLEELQTVRNTRFFNLDVNRDHQLSHREVSANIEWKQRFGRLDTNEDGHISLKEFESKGRTRFKAIDEDRNGRITPREALVFQRKIRAHWEANLRARKTG